MMTCRRSFSFVSQLSNLISNVIPPKRIPQNDDEQQQQQQDEMDITMPERLIPTRNNHSDNSFNPSTLQQQRRQEEENDKGNRSNRLAEIEQLIHHQPHGSFTASTWMQAERCLRYLVDQPDQHQLQPTSDQKGPPPKEQDIEDVGLAIQLLDRMVLEPDGHVQVTSDLVFSVYAQWSRIFSKLHGFHTYHLPFHRKGAGRQSQLDASTTMATTTRNTNTSIPITTTTNAAASPNTLPLPSVMYNRLEHYQTTHGITLHINAYHKVIEGTWSCGKSKRNGPDLAETILRRLLEHSQHSNPLLRPTTSTFNAVLTSWQLSWDKSNEASTRALKLLRLLQSLYKAGWGEELKPDRNSFYFVMYLLADQGEADQVEGLLEELYELYMESGCADDSLAPRHSLFSLVLQAWGNYDDTQYAAERAQQILERMLELERLGKQPSNTISSRNEEGMVGIRGLRVTAAHFNMVSHIWSRSRAQEAGQRVQELFDLQSSLGQSDQAKRPNGGSYAALLGAWSHVNPVKAETVMWEWKQQYEAGNCEEMRVILPIFHAFLAGWYHSESPQAAEKCEQILQLAINGEIGECEYNITSFNMAVHAWARRGTWEDMERAEMLLKQMEEYGKKHPEESKGISVRYIPVINGWAKIGQVERADNLIRKCAASHSLSQEQISSSSVNKENQHLDVRSLNHVLNGWLSKVPMYPHAAERAEDLLLSSISTLGIQPSAMSFQIVLKCWHRHRRYRSQSPSAGHHHKPRVQKIIDMMDGLYRSGAWNNSRQSYLTLRQEWSKQELEPMSWVEA